MIAVRALLVDLARSDEGAQGLALYRACDVRRALEAGSAAADDSAWDRLGA